MKNIRITHDIPSIPAELNLTHTATDWQISLYPDFSVSNKILLESLEDTVNLNSYATTLDIDNDTAVYVRVRYHFGDKVSNWSRVAEVNSDQRGFKVSNTIVETPVVYAATNYDRSPDGELLITTSPFQMHAGTGSHAYTTWEIYDADGVLVYRRAKDPQYLTELRISDTILDPYKAYEIKATHISTTNTGSNPGKLLYNQSIKVDNLYKITPINPLIVNSTLYFNLQLFTTAYDMIDIVMYDKNTNVVSSNYLQQTILPSLDLSGVAVNEYYSIYARIHLTTGLITPYVKIWSGISRTGTTTVYDPNMTYLEKFSYANDLLTNGITGQSITQLSNGTILFGKQNTNKIYSANYDGNVFSIANAAIVLPEEDIYGIPFTCVLPLYNGNVVVMYSVENKDKDYHDMRIAMFTHKILTDTFTLTNTLKFDNMSYTPGITGAAVVYTDNNIYFIPYMETDLDGNYVDVSLYMLETNTFTVSKVLELPFSAKCAVSMANDPTGNLIILGGSDIGADHKAGPRTNNTIYTYHIGKREVNEYGTLPAELSADTNIIQCYIRGDGNIVGFNAVSDGPTLGNQDVLLINTSSKIASVVNTDIPVNDIPYRTTVLLTDGDFLRVSSRDIDPQKVYVYVSNTMPSTQVKQDTNPVLDVTDVVVRAGEVITIESFKGLNSVTINGTNTTDTGILRWLSDGKVIEFTYSDLIIFNNVVLTAELQASGNYTSYNIVDGGVLEVIM